MRRDVYLSMQDRIRAQDGQGIWDFKAILRQLVQEFPAERKEAIRSIIQQAYVERAKTTYYRHKGAKRRKEVYKQVMEDLNKDGYKLGVIVEISKVRNISPILMARLILEEYLKDGKTPEEAGHQDREARAEVNKLLRNTHMIPDPKLSLEVKHCTWVDDVYGPYAECIKAATGAEAEDNLKKMLKERGMAFKDEDDLRKEGYDKTPDILLIAPFGFQGKVVNWIESKALFGDEKTHAEYIQSQLSSYWNRFGPGMVIYWHGFVEEIASFARIDGIRVRDSLPEDHEIVRMDPFWDLPEEEDNLFQEEDQGQDQDAARTKEESKQNLSEELQKLELSS